MIRLTESQSTNGDLDREIKSLLAKKTDLEKEIKRMELRSTVSYLERKKAFREGKTKDDPDKGDCFIVTAAYGTPMAAELDVLRSFRDRSLLTNCVGKQLVAAYYKVSPPIADNIRQSDTKRMVVRALLAPFIKLLR